MISNAWTWAIGTLILTAAYFWEVSDDPRGDLDKKRDVWIRGVIMLLTSALNAVMNGCNLPGALGLLLVSFNLAAAWFFMFFDYTIAAIMIRNDLIEPRKGGNWYNHEGKTSEFDKLDIWVRIGPVWRLVTRVVYLLISIAIYVIYAIYYR